MITKGISKNNEDNQIKSSRVFEYVALISIDQYKQLIINK